VDSVPWPLKPLYWVYGYGLGFSAYFLAAIFHVTCSIKLEGEENLIRVPNAIFAYWHHHNIPSFVSFYYRKRNIVAFNHPGWYMKPVHIILLLLALEIFANDKSGEFYRRRKFV